MSNSCRRSAYNHLILSDHRWPRFAAAWPGWQILFIKMDQDEAIDWGERIIWLNCHARDPLFQAAHSVAHLRLHYGQRGEFTDRQEEDASWRAMMWLAWTQPQVERAELTTGEN